MSITQSNISEYKTLSNTFNWLRNYYKLMEVKDKELYDYIVYLDSKIKEIDRSIGTKSDGGKGSYKGTFKSIFK